MISFSGVSGPRGLRECCFSLPGYEARAECLAARGGHERKFNRCFSPSLSRNVSHRHEAQCSSLSVKASDSDSGKYGSRSEEFSSKGKKRKSSKARLARKDREQEPLIELLNEELLLAETKTTISKPVEMVDGLQVEEVHGSWTDDDKHLLATALDKLEALCLHASALEQWHGSCLVNVHRKYRRSAQNLLHYVAVKSVDLKEVHSSLPTLGLASIEGVEGHVMASLSRTIGAARALFRSLASDTDAMTGGNHGRSLFLKDKKDIETNVTVAHEVLPPISVRRSKLQLSHNTIALFGPRTSQRKTYIMVTLSEEVIQNEDAVLDLMKAGMDIARINCAHGNPAAWGSIIQTVKRCSQMLEQPCRVLMDLAGPKLRTSPFPAGPCVQKIKPHRDGLGNVTLPARVWIALSGTPVPEGMSADAIVPVKGDTWLGSLQVGDKLRVRDGRGKQRQLIIADKVMGSQGLGCWAECFETTYLESGAKLELSNKKGRLSFGHVADLPPLEHFIRLKKGDIIVLTKESSLEEASLSDKNEAWIYRIQVSHTFGQLFESVKPGELIRFDDGRIEGVIRGITSSEICVEVTFADEKGTKLGGEKSINLPNSNLSQKGLTVKDMVDLDFVVGHADMVALSFVKNSQDVQALQQALKRKGATNIGVVLKIETRSGVMNLSEILLQGMKSENPLGVMIARGDLAVECGWESMAGVQEELLHACKAAHVPTIWATQVLEGLTKQGLPTRPEITDAALGGRAACVMLNKGFHVLKAVYTLNRILDNSVSPWWDVYASNQPFGISSLVD
ncbi:hypothetical protein GOP47_0004148 [Adiantum capillus-veneris]|uniref:pyruvate kinase n=1 Tax=Adiantum capillus-veneris TaxID=13818 RepID=A0A9D4ZQ41_ADICA|nr:hypothetical protein GOP47_0004148 [Adiantum capillus-veneris]